MDLLHQRLGHMSTRSQLDEDTENVWQDIEIRVDPDTFCTPCQIFTINKNSILKTTLNPNKPFKWVLMDIVPAKRLTKYTTFYNNVLIVDAYSKTQKRY